MRRVLLGTTDQALSSASNVLFILSLARTLSPKEFGFYALAYACLAAGLAVFRGAIGTPITLRAGEIEQVRIEASFGLGATLIVSIPASILIIALSALVDIPVHPAFFLGLPILLIQDLGRISALSAGKVGIALLADGLWFTVSAGLISATWIGAAVPAGLGSGIWVTAGGLSAVLLLGNLGIQARFIGLREFFRVGRGERIRFGAEGSIAALGSLITASAVTGLISPLANAALRGAGTVVGPINVLLGALQVAVVPELRRRRISNLKDALPVTLPVISMIVLCAIGVGAFGLLAPTWMGQLLLGESWMLVAPILIVVSCEYLGQALLANATCILRARAQSRSLLRARLALTGGQVFAGVSAAVIFGSAASVAVASALVVWLVAVGLNVFIVRVKLDVSTLAASNT